MEIAISFPSASELSAWLVLPLIVAPVQLLQAWFLSFFPLLSLIHPVGIAIPMNAGLPYQEKQIKC